jgi:hypothetical protein
VLENGRERWFSVRQVIGVVGSVAVLILTVGSPRARGASALVLDSLSNCGPALSSTVEDCQAPTVAAYGGWVAWSHSDAITGQFALMLRSPAGVISAASVPERVSPFDVQLGPSDGGIVAVYSRCSNTLTLRGCNIFELTLSESGAAEAAVRIPGGGSVHEPAIWGNRMVLLRRDPSGGSEGPTFAGHRPDGLFSWRIGSGRLRALVLPGSQGIKFPWPRGLVGVVSGLAFDGKQLAYSTGLQLRGQGVVSLWHQGLGGSPTLVDQTTSGGASVCRPAFLSPTFSGGWVYSYFHACTANGDVGADRWTRYSLGGHRTQRARVAFLRYPDELIFAVVPVASGVVWDNGEVLESTDVTWRPISRQPVLWAFLSCMDRDFSSSRLVAGKPFGMKPRYGMPYGVTFRESSRHPRC